MGYVETLRHSVPMTAATVPAPTPDEVVETVADWAKHFPSGRFVVARVDHDDTWRSTVLCWGLAFPDHVVFERLEFGCLGTARTTEDLMAMLRKSGDVRLIWVDREPERWPEEEPD